MRRALLVLTVVFVLPRASAAQDQGLGFETANIKMRDGVILRADVYRPRAEGRYPVLLMRTPYNRRGAVGTAIRLAQSGYAVVVQDVRGRFGSDGDWNPFRFEAQDGHDTIEWAAAQPWANGKVGMWGGSYVGATQMLAAITRPPHLAGVAPLVTASNYHEGWTYQGGAFAQWFGQSWTASLAEDTLSRRARKPRPWTQWDLLVPLVDFPALEPGPSDGLAPYFREWLEHPSYDDYWKAVAIDARFDSIAVPGLHIGGWYDIFQAGSWRNYVGIRARGATPEARAGQRLIMGPWGHGGEVPKVGDLDFGPQAKFDYVETVRQFYDGLLKGQGAAASKPVRLFVMGRNAWRDEDDWPLRRARATRYHLRSGGRANGLGGNGTLSPTPPGNEPPDRFVYDPADPVPTRGGGLCCGNARALGPLDQRPVEARGDVLVYSTPPLARDTEVTGPVTLQLWVQSSAVDTDFTAKLVDVWPNGYAQNLTDGILRMRYRASRERPELMTPGETYKIEIDLWATSNLFRAGHRIRLEVASSNHPRFDRNPNTGESTATSARMVKATNVVLHDRQHPSALVLPVVP